MAQVGIVANPGPLIDDNASGMSNIKAITDICFQGNLYQQPLGQFPIPPFSDRLPPTPVLGAPEPEGPFFPSPLEQTEHHLKVITVFDVRIETDKIRINNLNQGFKTVRNHSLNSEKSSIDKSF